MVSAADVDSAARSAGSPQQVIYYGDGKAIAVFGSRAEAERAAAAFRSRGWARVEVTQVPGDRQENGRSGPVTWWATCYPPTMTGAAASALRMAQDANFQELKAGDRVQEVGDRQRGNGTIVAVSANVPNAIQVRWDSGVTEWAVASQCRKGAHRMANSIHLAARRGAVAMASAADWHAKITANVDDYYANRVSYEEFGRRNRALWDAIAADGKQDAVSRLISREQKAAGLFTRGRSAKERVTRNGTTGRVLRRYSLEGAAWLLVETAPGIKVSWPEGETRPVGAAQRARTRALQMARPSDFKKGDRVIDEHGQQGTVVGPGAGGTRVIIQWDDGSSSNLSAVDLEAWGVEHASPTLHARSDASTMARIGDSVACPVCAQPVKVIGVTVPGRGDEPGAGPYPHLASHDNPSTGLRCAGTLRDASTLARGPQMLAARRPATLDDARAFEDFRALRVPLAEVQAAVAKGGKLEIEESGFKDAGGDYSALYLDGRAIGRMEGYSRGPRALRTMAAGSWLKAGDRIELLDMPEDPNPVPRGTKGTVEWASDVDFGGGDRFTQVGVRWENGRSLMLSIPPDRVRKI